MSETLLLFVNIYGNLHGDLVHIDTLIMVDQVILGFLNALEYNGCKCINLSLEIHICIDTNALKFKEEIFGFC